MTPQEQQSLTKIVIAGMQHMYSPKTFKTFKAGMTGAGDLPQKLASEAAGLVKILQDKARGGIPRPLLIPAAYMLMLEIAHFMETAKIAKPTPQDIASAFKLLVPLMAKEFPNISPRGMPASSAPLQQGAPAAPAAPPANSILAGA